MTRLICLVLATLFCAAVAAGVAPAAQGGAAPDYFPLTSGAVWTYRTNVGPELVMRVRGTRQVGGISCRVIESLLNGMVTQRECYARQGDTVFAYLRGYATGDLPLIPPQPSLRFPPQVGLAWAWEGRAGQSAEMLTLTMQWARSDNVIVPAGSFQTMQLYIEGFAGTDRVQSWRWFAPEVGLVKEDSIIESQSRNLRIVAELVKFQSGK